MLWAVVGAAVVSAQRRKNSFPACKGHLCHSETHLPLAMRRRARLRSARARLLSCSELYFRGRPGRLLVCVVWRSRTFFMAETTVDLLRFSSVAIVEYDLPACRFLYSVARWSGESSVPFLRVEPSVDGWPSGIILCCVVRRDVSAQARGSCLVKQKRKNTRVSQPRSTNAMYNGLAMIVSVDTEFTSSQAQSPR